MLGATTLCPLGSKHCFFISGSSSPKGDELVLVFPLWIAIVERNYDLSKFSSFHFVQSTKIGRELKLINVHAFVYNIHIFIL